MSTTVLSPNMNITVPVPGEETGPQWATDLYNALYSVIDQHDHSSTKGVAISSGSVNVNADFPFNNYNITGPRTLRLQPQSTSITASTPDLTCIYAAPNGGSGVYDLWYNDGAGNQVPLTKNGAVTGTAGSITGLPSGTASASFGSSTFTFQSATNTAASVDCRNIVLRNSTASSNALTISPPDAMGANITMKMPTIPSSTKIMSMDNSGNMYTLYGVDGTTITISSNNIGIPTGGVNTTQIASGAVTRPKIAALGQQISSSATQTIGNSLIDVTNLTVTITTSGRPIMLFLQSASTVSSFASTAGGVLVFSNTSLAEAPQAMIVFVRGSTVISSTHIGLWAKTSTSATDYTWQGPNCCYIDNPGAGTYTYKVQAISASANVSVQFTSMQLVAYEIG